VAEVGVYKGDFAARINQLFNDRCLYLFDTFTGFTDVDANVDQEKNFSLADQDFSDTSIESVKSKMPFPAKCIFKPGFFPDTAKGIEDKFCFVSLDADLFQPIYEGLKFFYPRLSNGGYIFIHDFNNENYKGAKHAVKQFCEENKIGYLPVPDSGGTAVICR
jgi:O-methyltransferase